MRSRSDAHLRLDRVGKRYGAVTALHEIDLAVEEGELLTLLGPSGCGKTTVLRLVAGFAEPSSGRILIDDVPVTHLPPNRRSIGMVFQSYALFPHLTIAQNIAFGLEEHGLARVRIRERVAELLDLVRLPEVAERYPAQLSGGQQQRIALARAVAYAPRVLLMDEPLGALDLKLREAMQIEIRRIQKTLGITTLYVTHDQTEAMRISDRIAIMNGGRIEQCGTVSEIYAEPRTRFVADFIGKINFIDGRIVAAEGGVFVVQTEVGVHRCAAVAGIGAGDDVALGIRPDDIMFARAPGDEGDVVRVTGTIEEKAFLGTFDELRVRVSPSLSLQIEARPGLASAVAGDSVEISWQPERCRLFRTQQNEIPRDVLRGQEGAFLKAPWAWFFLVPLLLSAGLIGVTQYAFLEKSFYQELGLGLTGPPVGLDNYIAVLRLPYYRNAIQTTVVVAAAAAAGCILFGYPLAYTIARLSSRWGMVMLTAVLLASLVTTPIKVLGLIIIFAKESGLNRLLLWLGVVNEPVTVLGNRVGVILGLIYYSLAFAVLLLYSVIRTIPVALEEAAAIQGCSRLRTLWRVVLPLSMPGLTAVALTVFNLSMGAFAAAALMGAGRVPTLPVVIYQTIFIETKYATASTLAMILLVLVLLVNLVSILLLARFGAPQSAADMARPRRSARRLLFSERAGDALRAARARMARWGGGFGQRLRATGIHLRPLRILSWLSIAWVYLFLFAPLLIIVGASLNGGSNRSGTVMFPPRQLSLDWYLAMPTSHLWSIGLSVAVAGLATLIACLIALPAGLGLVRSRAPGREVAAVIFRLPLQIPVVIVGLSFFYAFYAIDDAVGSGLVGSFAGLVIAHCFVLTPFVIGSVTAVLQRFDERLEEAAQSLGAGRWRTFRRVTLPVIAPGVFAGAVYAFLVSFGDVPISLFLAGTGTVTFPVTVFHSLEVDFDATVLASSTLVMVMGMGILIVVQRLMGLDAMLRSEAGARG